MLPEITNERIALARVAIQEAVVRIYAGWLARQFGWVEFQFNDDYIHHCGENNEGVGFGGGGGLQGAGYGNCEPIVTRLGWFGSSTYLKGFHASFFGDQQIEVCTDLFGRKKEVKRWTPESHVQIRYKGEDSWEWDYRCRFHAKFYLREKKWEYIPSGWEETTDHKEAFSDRVRFVIFDLRDALSDFLEYLRERLRI